MLSYKVKIGIAPCRRDMPGRPGGRARMRMWSAEAAKEVLDVVMPYIRENFTNEHVEFVDLEGVTEDGMMWDYMQAQKLADYFTEQKIDALFIPNINFGSEEVAGKLASLLGLPTLIWAVQDEYFGETETKDIYDNEYGARLLDAQCGLFAVSKILQRYHVKFTQIPTCKVTDDTFKEGFVDFLAVALMLKNFRNMRVMQIGNRPKAFTSMMFNEDELLEKFGIEVFPFTTAEAAQMIQRMQEEHKDELRPLVEEFLSYFPAGDKIDPDDPGLKRCAAVLWMYRELYATTGCSAISVDNSMTRFLPGPHGGTMDFMMAANEGKFLAFESDLLASIMMVIASSATFGEKLPFFGEFTANHPTNPNAELIWHTAVYPPKVAGNQTFDPYIIKSDFGFNTGFEVAPGEYTICRFDCMDGKYAMIMGNYKSVPGPFTRSHYMWGEFKDWKKFEQATIYGPYVHHMVEIEGGPEVVRRLKEFCRYTGIFADVPDERESPFADYFYKP